MKTVPAFCNGVVLYFGRRNHDSDDIHLRIGDFNGAPLNSALLLSRLACPSGRSQAPGQVSGHAVEAGCRQVLGVQCAGRLQAGSRFLG